MAKITNDEIVKAASDAVEAVAGAVEPTVKKARKAAKKGMDAVEPTVKKARKAAGDAAKKASAPLKPEIYLQYDFKEANVNDLVAAAKAAFHAEQGRVAVKSCKIYLKPQENAAYYVINEDYVGKLDL
ncbi:MAG: DUF6465 family protein [Clostridiales bacterium]|nr:DUF6465 family protein [Clostridiales bacterium]